MSQENLEIVRTPLAVRTDSRRRLDERLCVWFPGGFGFYSRAILRLPRHSRLRGMMLRRAVRLGLEASNRRDFEAAFSLYHRDIELTVHPQLVSLGFDPVYRGREARISFQERWVADWREFRFEPDELIDLGGSRVLILGRMEGSGVSSGAAFGSEWGTLLTFSAGRAVRERFFFDRGEALDAAGLAE